MEENQGIPRTEAWPISGLEMECPECHETVQELGGDPRDMTQLDPENEGEIECPFCGTLFIYNVSEY